MYPARIPYVSCMYPACRLRIRYISLWMHLRYMYPSCIPHMYPACILMTSEDTCIPHVSRMYLASEIRTSPDTFEIHVSHYVFLMYPACILHVSSNRCRYMYPACIPHVSHMYLLCILRAFLLAGVPTLQQLQGRAKEMKRARTAAVQLDQLIDLKNLALTYFQPMPQNH